MARGLVQGLLLVLLVLTGGRELCAAPLPPTPGETAEHSLTLLQQADLQTLTPAARQQLLLGVAEQQLAAGQSEQALPLLTRALSEAQALTPPLHDRLRRLVSHLATTQLTVLATSVAGTPAASFLQALLAERRAAEQQATVAVLLPLSGRYAPYGELVRRGIELARAVTPPGKGVQFRFHDTAGDGATAEQLVDTVAGESVVQAVIGPLTSGEALPASARAATHRLPMLLLAPREGTTASAQGVFRLALTAEAQVRAIVGHAAGVLGLKRFAVLAPATRQGERYAELFQAEVIRLGGQLVARQNYAADSVDLRGDLQALASALRAGGAAEALFLPDDPRQVGQIAPQLGFARLDQLQLLGIASWHTPELMRLTGPALEGALLADSFCAAGTAPPIAPFVEAFRRAHGSEPTALDALGFDSAGLLLAALAAPGVHDRQTLAQAIAGGRDYPGVTGAIRFAANGETNTPLCLLQLKAGAFTPLN